MVSVGERIAHAIRESGKRPADIARDCGVTASAVTQWANAKSLKGETALHLEAATGFRAYWLLFGKGPRRLEDKPVAWPFRVPIERVAALERDDLLRVEGALEAALLACEQPPPPSGGAETFSERKGRQQTAKPIRNQKV